MDDKTLKKLVGLNALKKRIAEAITEFYQDERHSDLLGDLVDIHTGEYNFSLPLKKPLAKCKTHREALNWAKEWFGVDDDNELLVDDLHLIEEEEGGMK